MKIFISFIVGIIFSLSSLVFAFSYSDKREIKNIVEDIITDCRVINNRIDC